MAFADKTLICRDCGKEFVFSAGEQEFFREKGFTHDPTRCPECRAARRGNPRPGGSDNPRPRRMYPVVCADCGAQTEVPFEPRGDRPVYCRDCFEKHRNGR
ncbi:MAG: zinc-ribbon domain containing protein [Anaerolineae bacterium]|nr:zinc-ribbon domain containing protein [Anaerolineae bacterium]